MQLYNMRASLLILAALSCCSCIRLVPTKISGVKGKNVTFPLTIPPSFQVSIIAWSFESSSGNSAPVFSFGEQKKTVPSPYVGRVVFNQTTFKLLLGPLTLADSGTYKVTILDNDLLSMMEKTQLEVLEPVADATILSNASEAVEFNSSVTLTCSAKGSFLTYKWLNGSATIMADGKHLLMNGNQLIISGVLRTDLCGPIYCTAQNTLESSTSTAFNLSISYGPESVAVTKIPDTEVLKKGSNLTLSCSAVSSPVAELKWFFNGADLLQKGPSLPLSNLGENQSGNYSCVAYNIKTKRSAASEVVTLSIIGPISGTSITGSSSLLFAGNSTYNLTCIASVGKPDNVLWFKGDKPLAVTDRIIFTPDKSTITFQTVQKEDAGLYTCQLINKVSNSSSSYKMNIIYGPEKPNIVGPVKVATSVVIECKVNSFPPANYTWKLNGSLLEITTAKLTIEKPDFKSSGIYTCEAQNHLTGLRMTANHTLTLNGEGELNYQLSDGAVAGIVIAVLLVVAIIIAVIVRKRRKPSEKEKKPGTEGRVGDEMVSEQEYRWNATHVSTSPHNLSMSLYSLSPPKVFHHRINPWGHDSRTY